MGRLSRIYRNDIIINVSLYIYLLAGYVLEYRIFLLPLLLQCRFFFSIWVRPRSRKSGIKLNYCNSTVNQHWPPPRIIAISMYINWYAYIYIQVVDICMHVYSSAHAKQPALPPTTTHSQYTWTIFTHLSHRAFSISKRCCGCRDLLRIDMYVL